MAEGEEAPRESSALAHRKDESLAVQADINGGKLGRWRIQAVGLTGGAVLSAASLVGILGLGDPMHKSGHFALALVAVFVAGAFVHAIMARGRMKDALEAKEHYRKEVEKEAADRRRLEQQVLKKRLTSTTPPKKSKRR